MSSAIGLGLTVTSLAIWIGLLCFRGQFWQADRYLHKDVQNCRSNNYPAVGVVIPARNEAELLPLTLRSLLNQDYPGSVTIILVDDQSTDGTASVAQALGKQIHALTGEPLPAKWKGKLWALEQGIRHAQTLIPLPDYLLLTDADIEHDPTNLRQLVTKAEQENLDMVSLMVKLRCQSVWEQLLIPAFVFFFQKLYPFGWVNDPQNPTAAAAGGCILIRRETLVQIGGIQVIRQALIDDCALAAAVKSNSTGRIWLGLTDSTCSLRPYPSLASIWDMVARTAYSQLNYSPWLLVGTLIGMTLVYIVPPVGVFVGLLTGNWMVAIASLISYLLMTLAYLPTIRLYRCAFWLAFCLPAIASLYTLMTLDSALRHYQGKGGAWKGRVYPQKSLN